MTEPLWAESIAESADAGAAGTPATSRLSPESCSEVRARQNHAKRGPDDNIAKFHIDVH